MTPEQIELYMTDKLQEERKTPNPNLYQVARDFFEDISEKMIQIIAKDECVKFHPSEENFRNNISWIIDQKLHGFGTNLEPLKVEVLEPNDVCRFMHGIERRGEDYVKKFATWFRKQKVKAETKVAFDTYIKDMKAKEKAKA